jgi:hypothetical protein
MALIFADGFEQYNGLNDQHDLAKPWNDLNYVARFPGLYTIEARLDGSAKVIRSHGGGEEEAILNAGDSIWGISWNGASYSVGPDAHGSQKLTRF